MRHHLADTSAIVRLLDGRAHDSWSEAAVAGRIAICPPVEAELAATARNQSDYEELQTYLRATFTWLPVPDSAWLIVAELKRELVKIGHHRGPSVPDLVIAATAIDHDYTVLHLDLDFEAVQKAIPINLARVDHPVPSGHEGDDSLK